MVINRYITKYTTKGEKMKTAQLWATINKSKSPRSQLLSLVLRLFRSREVGHYEACDKVSGHPLHKSNVRVDFLNTNKKGLRHRRLVSKKELDGMNDASKAFVKNNFIDTYYPQRPAQLEDRSMFYVFTWYDYQNKKPNKMVNKEGEPNFILPNGLGYFIKRVKPRWIRSYMPVPNSPETAEDYFRRLLMMFLPWRDEDTLQGSWSSFQEAYEANADTVRAEADKYLSQRRRMDETTELMKKLREEREAEASRPVEPDDELPVIAGNQFDGLTERFAFHAPFKLFIT